MGTITADFDYGQLPEKISRSLQGFEQTIRSLGRDTILQIGKQLLEAKELLEHGQFQAWVQDRCGIDPRIARRWMHVAAVFKTDNLSVLPLGQSALYLLAAPSCPEDAREEAISRASEGEVIGYTKAKEIIESHRPAPEPKPEPEEAEWEPVEDEVEYEEVDQDDLLARFLVLWNTADEETIQQITDVLFKVSMDQGECVCCRKPTKAGTPTGTGKPIDVGFDRWWSIVPNKVGKQAARREWPKAIDRIRRERTEWNQAMAMDFLTDRMQAWAASPQAQDDVKGTLHPRTWLSQGRYDDDDSAWGVGVSGGKQVTEEDIDAKRRREEHLAKLRARRAAK